MTNFKFSIDNFDGKARAGKIITKHGSIKTPVFMPVGTSATVKAIFPHDLLNLDFEIILANTYHLMLRPGENLIKNWGITKFYELAKTYINRFRRISSMVTSKIKKVKREGIDFVSHIDGKKYKLTPESAILIQEKLNSTITMVLDECTEYPASYLRSKNSMELSLEWAEKCKRKFKKRGLRYFLELFKEVCLTT